MVKREPSAPASALACLLASLILVFSPGLPCCRAVAAAVDADVTAARPIDIGPVANLGIGANADFSLQSFQESRIELPNLGIGSDIGAAAKSLPRSFQESGIAPFEQPAAVPSKAAVQNSAKNSSRLARRPAKALAKIGVQVARIRATISKAASGEDSLLAGRRINDLLTGQAEYPGVGNRAAPADASLSGLGRPVQSEAVKPPGLEPSGAPSPSAVEKNKINAAPIEGRPEEHPLLAKLRALWKNQAFQRSAFALLGAAAVLSWPVLWAHQGAAFISTAFLILIGLPQIAENFTKGAKAADGVSIGTNFIWMTLSFSLLSAGLLTHSGWWIASNSFSALKRIVIGAQINHYRRSPKLWLQSGLVLAGGLALLALGFFPIYFSAGTWASIVTVGAIGLLFFINLPQIKKDYLLYRAPAPRLPNRSKSDSAMLVLAAVFGIVASLAAVNLQWAIINVVSLATALIMAGQIFMPARTNALLAKVFNRGFP
ncbi:MAG: hypothetical protein ACYCPQ_08615 [Elusimicrobiota bacterium]